MIGQAVLEEQEPAHIKERSSSHSSFSLTTPKPTAGTPMNNKYHERLLQVSHVIYNKMGTVPVACYKIHYNTIVQCQKTERSCLWLSVKLLM